MFSYYVEPHINLKKSLSDNSSSMDDTLSDSYVS